MDYRGQKSAEHDDLLRLWLSSRGHDDRPQAVVSHHTALALYELAEFIPTPIRQCRLRFERSCQRGACCTAGSFLDATRRRLIGRTEAGALRSARR
jgi:hypothetical protein